MAVDQPEMKSTSEASAGRRLLIGTNVTFAVVLVVAIVVIAQAIAYSVPQRWDMTSSRVNSLASATEKLIGNLDTDLRLTSLYFETDQEEEDQPRYRQAALDLLDLYEATNRTRVNAEWINPLKDHEKFGALLSRLGEKTVYAEGIADHRARLDKYTDELDSQMRSVVQSELDQIGGLGTAMTQSAGDAALASIEDALGQLSRMLEKTREQLDAALLTDHPQYSLAVNRLKTFYSQFASTLGNVAKFASEQVKRSPNMEPRQADFLREAGNRYAILMASIEGKKTGLQSLEPLKLDELMVQLGPTTNAILVETDDDARVVDFASLWPPLGSSAGGRTSFRNRAFKGEEKLTSTILRVTHKEQTAVVFVRYGGMPLLMGGFMPGQPPAPMAAMKTQLEDANFVVKEWDVKASLTPPVIDPTPTRMIFVLFKPTPAQRGPMGQPSQEPPFGESHRQAIFKAMGDEVRALFIAGWYPGPFPMMPSTYEYNEYLKEDFGVSVNTSALLIETMNIAPGKYVVTRRDFPNMADLSVGEHDIVSGPLARELVLPMCAPLILADPLPEGVELTRLVELPFRDGVWGVQSLQVYGEQLREREYLTRAEGDLEGPFDLAVAASNGDSKIVVVSSAGFAADEVAFARFMDLSGGRLRIRYRNPGNVPLLINSLHWLNDNTEFMNIGKPIDAAVLQVKSESTVKVIQALTIFAWPMFAMFSGGVVWWVRRR